MQKSLNILLAIIVIVLACMQLFQCNNNKEVVGLYDAQIKNSQNKIDSLKAVVDSEKDTIQIIVLKQDTIIQDRIIIREKSGEEIEKAKSVSEKEADSLLNDRFPTKKDNWVFTKISDSIRLELRSTKTLYLLEQQKSFSLMNANKANELIINQKNNQISINKKKYKSEIKKEKKKKFRWFGWGFVVGVGAAGVAVVVLN